MYYFRVVTFSEFILEKLNYLSNYCFLFHNYFLFLYLLKLYYFFIIFLSQNTENMCRTFFSKKVRHKKNNFFVFCSLFFIFIFYFHLFWKYVIFSIIFLSQNTENMCRTFFSKKVRHKKNNFLSQNTENMCRTFFSKKVRHKKHNFFCFCSCCSRWLLFLFYPSSVYFCCSRWLLFLFYPSSVYFCSIIPQLRFLETLRYESIIHISFCKILMEFI